MHITRIHLEGFKRFTRFDLVLNPVFNVIVGDNETGKSSLLEAIGMVLTGQYDGRLIQYAIDPYFFNAGIVAGFFSKMQNGESASPPQILIEAYLASDGKEPDLEKLRGHNNTRGEDCPGLKLAIEVDQNYLESLKEYASDSSNPTVLPVEFFSATWRSFVNNSVTLRNLPFRVTTINTSLPRMHRDPNKHLFQIVNDVLDESQRRDLSLQYKKLRHRFAQEPGVKAINTRLEKGKLATAKKLSIQMDLSSRTTWDSAITAHLDDLPFYCAGQGEQSRLQLRFAIAAATRSRVLLIEEPENHLSHSNLNTLLDDIKNDCGDRQVIITTHSAFVLNKLGIDNVILISGDGRTASLTGLEPSTKDYFMKLPGYDTLRLILSRRSILVEGPSDELIVQRAYKDRHHRLPLEDGVDVIAVGSLAFKRFLDIAGLLNLDVCVVTDNDGNVAALQEKYAAYRNMVGTKICWAYDDDETCPTLEPQLLKANSLDVLNSILGKAFKDDIALRRYMEHNKTDCALKMFMTPQAWTIPEYISSAVK